MTRADADKSDLRIGILSQSNDLHAFAARKRLASEYGVVCHIVETDRIAGYGAISWRPGEEAILRDIDKQDVPVAELDLIWCRRVFLPQEIGGELGETEKDLINSSVPIALLGALQTSFRGAWVSQPSATLAAENKLVQLQAATSLGIPVPRTLVSNDPDHIRAFCSAVGKAIVKPLRPSRSETILTELVDDAHLGFERGLQSCPAIYQAYVEGGIHLRVHVFGEAIVAVAIESELVDWRCDLRVPFKPVELDAPVADRAKRLVQHLGLRMGVLDYKLSGGEAVFLEINPQGQYLFSEGLAGVALNRALTDFLYDEARRHRKTL